MPAAHVQHAIGDEWFNSDANITVAPSPAYTAGDAGVLFIWWDSTTITISTVSDGVNTWTLIGSPQTGGGWSCQAAYAMNLAAGTPTITVTFSAATANKQLVLHEASGVATTSALDGSKYAYIQANGVDAITTGVFTTTADGNYIAAAVISPNQNQMINASGTGYTTAATQDDHAQTLRSEYQIQGTASSSTVGTFSTSGLSDGLVMAVALKAAGGGGGRTTKNTRSAPLGTEAGMGFRMRVARRPSGLYIPERMAA